MAKAKREKQADLPEMEDRAIKPLEEAAVEYAEIRDQRIELNQQEVALKNRVREIMAKHSKIRYAYDGVEIEIVPSGDSVVKVKIAKKKDDAEDDNADDS